MFKFRLDPNVTQGKALGQSLETHRRVYNDALAARKLAWEQEQKTLRLGEQYPLFAARRNVDVAAEKRGEEGPHWLAHITAVSMRDTIKRLDKAFDAFFRRTKAGEQPGYPRFRSRDRYDSIPFDNYANSRGRSAGSGCDLRTLDGNFVVGDLSDDAPKNGFRLRLFGVGCVRVRLHRPIKGKIKTVAVKREAERWYVVFSCDLGNVPVEPSALPPVGIDVGLEAFLTTSEGEREPNPRYLKAELPELRRVQRQASRRFQKGKKRYEQSKGCKKARKRVARLHARVKNLRKEHHHQTAQKLVHRYGTICVEKLNIRGMLGNHKLARHIGDAAWGGFVLTLKCKAESAGVRVIEVDPRGTSQQCSQCGATVKKDLSVRRHNCPHCGLFLHRDHNAALHVLQRGVGLPRPGAAEHNGSSGSRAPGRPSPLQAPS